MKEIKDCTCGRPPDIHSRWLDENEIFDGIVCPICEIESYGDVFAVGSESDRIIEYWNGLASANEKR